MAATIYSTVTRRRQTLTKIRTEQTADIREKEGKYGPSLTTTNILSEL